MSIITPMVRPIVRPMVTAMGEGGQRSPAQIIQSLFAQGQQGFWLPFTDFASLTQDSAGTLPYTALEQPVGRVLDRSGRGNHATQPTSTARGKVSAAVVSPPTRPYYLQLDGTDDSYTCGGGGSTTGFYYSDVVRPMGGGSRTLFYNSVFGLKSGLSVTISPQNKFVVYVGNGSSFQAFTSAETIVNGELAHCAVWDDVTNIYMQVKGGVVQSFVKPMMPTGPATINLYNTGAVEHFNGQITEPIYRAGPPPSAYERGVIRAYQMQKAGML